MVISHRLDCTCWQCLGNAYGKMIDGLGSQTAVGNWGIFGTTTFRTPHFPWCRGFPSSSSFRPNADFARHIFGKFIFHLEYELGERVDFVVADQLGHINRRLHQHFVLAAIGLQRYSCLEMSNWLEQHAGFCRILPFEKGAAYYISRFIGRTIDSCDWNLRIGEPPVDVSDPKPAGKVDVTRSVDLPSHFFHLNFTRRFRS